MSDATRTSILEKLKTTWQLLSPWAVLVVVAAVSASLVAGAFEPGFSATPLTISLFVILLFAIAQDLRARIQPPKRRRIFFDFEGPLLWLLFVYATLREVGPISAHLTPVIAGLLLILALRTELRVHVSVLGVLTLLEAAQFLVGRQQISEVIARVTVFSLAIAAPNLVRKFDLWFDCRRAVADEELKQTHDAHLSRDFGLETSLMPTLGELPKLSLFNRPTNRQMSLDYITESFNLQLDLLREALGLTTAAVLWRTLGENTLQLRACSSHRKDILEGPYPAAQGLPASVLGDDAIGEVSVSPIHQSFQGLPYYPKRNNESVGGVVVVPIPSPASVIGDANDHGPKRHGVLCVDRTSREPFTESERRVLHLTAQKLAYDVAATQRWKETDVKRASIERICAALQALNQALTLEQTAQASLDGVRNLVQVDFALLALKAEDHFDVVRAEGRSAEHFQGLQFPINRGLVTQVCRANQTLPTIEDADAKANTPIFEEERVDNLHSLLAVPLRSASRGICGALVVGAEAQSRFDKHARAILELYASQIAVRLDLANAHEQIHQLATIDGLTGLACHRVFQETLDQMISRADRRKTRVAFILCDIDHFKRLNDTYGHPFGDIVLRGVANVLGSAVRKVDLAARYGGEEFALLLEEASLDGAFRLAERVRNAVAALRFEHDTGPVQLTLSLGVSIYPDDAQVKKELIARGDQALYAAKEGGRDRVVAYANLSVHP